MVPIDRVPRHFPAACCNALQCVAVCCNVVPIDRLPDRFPAGVLQCVAVCCSVLQCVAVCCSVLQCGTVWWMHHWPRPFPADE